MNRCFAAVAAAAVIAFAAPAAAEVKKGDRASELSTVKDGKNRKLRLSALRGKVVVLTFGASWCKPCKAELPAYDKLAKKFAKEKAAVVFVAVNIDSERKNADKFLKETAVKSVRVGFDPSGGTVEKYEPGTMPTTYIIDAKGIVREVHAGYESGDEKDIETHVRKLLES
jgi:thiol-disulfide isomerase/thioredoxin